MIITEQNRNNNFDETRAFSAHVNGEKRPVRPKPNTGEPSRAERNPSNIQSRPTQPQHPQNVDGARPRPVAPQNMPQASRSQSPATPIDRAVDGGGVNNTRPANQNQAPRPVQRPVQMQSQQRNPAQAVNSQPQARQPLNNQPLNNQPLNNQPLNNQHLNPQPLNNKPVNPQPKSTVNPSAAQIKTPNGAKTVSDLDQSTKQISPAVSRQMMATRTTDVADIRIKDKPKTEQKRESSGEGGNTIISLVKAIVYIVFVCVISVFLAVTVILVGNDIFAFVKSDEIIEVVLPENTTLDDLSEILYENGVIEYPSVFKLYAVAKNDDQKYVAGTYTVTPMMNYSFLLAEFKEKIDYGTVRITIPEGYTTDEIIDLFVAEGIGTREGFIDVIENGEFDYWFINDLEANGVSEDRIYRLDGYLFPDTYDFYKNSSETTVINKLLRRFGQIFRSDYKEQCEKMGYTVDEIVTLASIIEKEAANTTEFFKVSSVFHNRLNNPWNFPKLESDATVVYVIQHETGERTVDLNYDTPYNTYKYNGLTPGPIANPSASAILAALTPQATNYYFFYSYDGVTYFSETKAQHEAYIEQFKNQEANGIPANIPEN